MPNKKKTFYASVTFTRGSPIKATTMSMLDHQSQTSHSSNQWLSLQSSKIFHLSPRFQPQCNHRPLLQQLLHIQSLLLRLRRSQLHQAAKNASGSRPFQKKKKKKKKNRSRREQGIEAPTPPPPLPQPPTTPSQLKTMAQLLTLQLTNQKNPEAPLELGATIFLQSLDVWPLHQMQILPDGSTRYRLAREEKKQLKFLGKKNLFITNWPKPDLHRKGPGRCKKT